MPSLSNQGRIKQIDEKLKKCYNLLDKFEKRLLEPIEPREELYYEEEVRKLKNQIEEYKNELEQLKSSSNTDTSNLKPRFITRKLFNYLILGLIVVIASILTYNIYHVYLTANQKKIKYIISSGATMLQYIDSVKHKEPVAKAEKLIVELKTSSDQCGENDYSEFQTGRIYLNIWINLPSNSKLKILWGDKTKDIVSSKNMICYSIPHKYSSKGNKEIIVYLVGKSQNEKKIAQKKIRIISDK